MLVQQLAGARVEEATWTSCHCTSTRRPIQPARRYIINLTGGGQLGVAEGKVDLPAGAVEYIDDLTGQGHTTANVGNAPRVSIHLEFADQNQHIGPLGTGQ